jgi:hypothetical protein
MSKEISPGEKRETSPGQIIRNFVILPNIPKKNRIMADL